MLQPVAQHAFIIDADVDESEPDPGLSARAAGVGPLLVHTDLDRMQAPVRVRQVEAKLVERVVRNRLVGDQHHAVKRKVAESAYQFTGQHVARRTTDLGNRLAWQHRSAPLRQRALENWAEALAPLAESIQLLLQLLRESGVSQKVLAERGHFQQNLPSGRTFQLLQLRINPALHLVPEISGNRLMVSVRLMEQLGDAHLQACTDDAAFELTLCA